MPRDAAFDKLLYGSAGPPKADAKAAPTAPATAAEAGSDFSLLHAKQRAGQGLAKLGAGALTGPPRAINAAIGLVKPEWQQTLGDLAESIPGVKRMEEFAQEPFESKAEGVGYGLGMLTPLGRFARLAQGQRAAQVAGAGQMPGKFYPGIGFVKTKPMIPRPPAPAATAGSVAGRAAAAVGGGAAMGAATDPKDPLAGATLGAVAGPAPKAAGAAMQAGQHYGGHVGRLLTYEMAAEALRHMGVPWWLSYPLAAPLLKYWNSPVGRRAAAGGEWFFDKAGRLLQRTDPAVVGGAAGAAENAAER